MKRLIIALALVLALVGSAVAVKFTQQFSDSAVSATATNSVVLFGFDARSVAVANDGANEIFITFSSTIATVSDHRIDPSEVFTFRLDNPTGGMGIICSAAETSTVRVVAVR